MEEVEGGQMFDGPVLKGENKILLLKKQECKWKRDSTSDVG